jgi:hypothetical protein
MQAIQLSWYTDLATGWISRNCCFLAELRDLLLLRIILASSGANIVYYSVGIRGPFSLGVKQQGVKLSCHLLYRNG